MRGAAAVPAVTLGVSSGYCLIVQLSDNATKGRSMPLEIVPKSPLAPDVPALQAWLAPHWPAAASGLRLSLLAGGQSNPTWLLTPAQGEPRVLRAKPGTEAYFERLIARWTRQYRASQTCELPAMERLIEWLPAHIPASARDPGALALLHGDFRLENMVFHPSEPRVLAVLDWELATLGHPLS